MQTSKQEMAQGQATALGLGASGSKRDHGQTETNTARINLHERTASRFFLPFSLSILRHALYPRAESCTKAARVAGHAPLAPARGTDGAEARGYAYFRLESSARFPSGCSEEDD